MSIAQAAVGDMFTAVKSREVQSGMLAEMRGETDQAARHFLAAAHLELVLAHDYSVVGQDDLSLRSRLSAASCFWRAGRVEEARHEFDALIHDYPAQASNTQDVRSELERDYPNNTR